MGWYGGAGWGWGGWLGMGLVMLVFWGLLVAGVIALVRAPGRDRSGGGSSGAAAGASPARQLLDERFARGEIDEKEYLHRRDLLGRN